MRGVRSDSVRACDLLLFKQLNLSAELRQPVLYGDATNTVVVTPGLSHDH
jgi:hypothetical protein